MHLWAVVRWASWAAPLRRSAAALTLARGLACSRRRLLPLLLCTLRLLLLLAAHEKLLHGGLHLWCGLGANRRRRGRHIHQACRRMGVGWAHCAF